MVIVVREGRAIRSRRRSGEGKFAGAVQIAVSVAQQEGLHKRALRSPSP